MPMQRLSYYPFAQKSKNLFFLSFPSLRDLRALDLFIPDPEFETSIVPIAC